MIWMFVHPSINPPILISHVFDLSLIKYTAWHAAWDSLSLITQPNKLVVIHAVVIQVQILPASATVIICSKHRQRISK